MPKIQHLLQRLILLTLLFLSVIGGAHANLAAPLPVGAQETWFLIAAEQGQARAERHNWQTGKVEQFVLKLPTHDSRNYRRHYAMAANRHGLWLAENTLALLRPDGDLVQLSNFFPDPVPRGLNSAESGDEARLLALPDDSVLLLRKLVGETKGKAFRLLWRNPAIVVQELGNVPEFNYGVAAVRLADGRILLAGGYGAGNRTWLFDPRDNRWSAAGNLGVTRLYAAIAALPDGRAFVAGNSWMVWSGNNHETAQDAASAAELFDPANNQWTRLPDLPLSFRLEAYGANGPSATVMPDGTLVVAGGMHTRVALLHPEGKGFAPNWRLSEPINGQRVGGIVQASGRNEVVVSGGRWPTESGQCCATRLDGERLRLPRQGEARRSSIGLQRADAAVAERDQLAFAAGGWEAFQLSTATTQASAVAELIDLRSGEVRDLASLPSPMLTGKALWLDDERIVVKAMAHSALYEQPFRNMDGRSLEFDTKGYLAVYSVKNNRWRTLDDPTIARAALAGLSGKEAILVDGAAQVWAFDTERFALRALPRPTQMRQGGAQRVLADGRIVLAGGLAQSELLEAYDADCRQRNCPLQYFAYGAMLPARNHEIFLPTENRWVFSTPSRAGSEHAVIRSDGRVTSLGRQTLGNEQSRWLIEQSDRLGKRWQTLPFPEGFDPARCNDSASAPENCRLLYGELPGGAAEVILFFYRHWDNVRNQYIGELWLFDETEKWLPVARDLSPEALATQKIRLRRLGNQQLYGTRFLFEPMRLSLE